MRSKPVIISLLILLAAFAVYIFFGINYLQQQREQEYITRQLEQLMPTLREGFEGPDDLEQRLAAARERLEYASQPPYLVMPSSIEVVDAVLRVARESRVEVSLKTDPVSIERIGEFEYRRPEFQITATGTLNELASFISNLEGGTIETLAIKQVKFARSDAIWIANIDAFAYTRAYPPYVASTLSD